MVLHEFRLQAASPDRRDPDSVARYSLAVTFEILGGEIDIYEPMRAAIAELQAQTEEVEAEAEVEVEVDE